MSKTVTFIGGPMHRQKIAVRETMRDIRMPVAPDHARFLSHADELPDAFEAPHYETDTYRIQDIEVAGVVVASIAVHEATMLRPIGPRIR